MKSHLGLIRCARYSFAPNSLKYCGPEKQRDMYAYVSQKLVDRGLGEMLEQFDTLYKYLHLIAYENEIRDPFDTRVVEAYWLGNNLLNKTKYKPLLKVLTDGLELPKKLTPHQLTTTISKLDQAVAHHTFHVLNIFRRTGHLPIAHTLVTMDSCRISWGTVKELTPSGLPFDKVEERWGLKIGDFPPPGKRRLGGVSCLVELAPLVIQNNSLLLGEPEVRKMKCIGLVPKVGDWVSIHWGYVCEVLNARQVANLEYYTKLAIKLANRR